MVRTGNTGGSKIREWNPIQGSEVKIDQLSAGTSWTHKLPATRRLTWEKTFTRGEWKVKGKHYRTIARASTNSRQPEVLFPADAATLDCMLSLWMMILVADGPGTADTLEVAHALGTIGDFVSAIAS